MSSSSQAWFTFTRLSKSVSAVLFLGWVLQVALPLVREYGALVAGRTVPFAWNILTAGFLETTLVKLIFDVAALLWVAKLIEPPMGSLELLRFLCAVNILTGAATLAVIYLIYAVDHYSEKAGDILYTEVCGFHGMLAGCLVALKQIQPDSGVTLFVYIKFRAKHLPLLFCGAASVASLILGEALSTIPFVLFGTYSGWFYLRFLQIKPELGLQGDPSNEFRFAALFPDALHGPVDLLASICSKVFHIGLSQAKASRDLPALHAAAVDPTESAEAARRRERGAKALEERMGKRAAAQATSQASSPPRPAASLPPDIETGVASMPATSESTEAAP
ncbi:hypothetical protein WJX74_000773 [Apatococcus lobatus]|uniref:Transmembrane protein 115 n=1 Tax=Apatococcus lobatus TaxID=904363 RepID=A0AAW1SDR9_9CHLO